MFTKILNPKTNQLITIEKENKICGIVYHSKDIDGLTSAILYKNYLEDILNEYDEVLMIPYNYESGIDLLVINEKTNVEFQTQNLFEKDCFSLFDELIFVDISPNFEFLLNFTKYQVLNFENDGNKNTKVKIIDHHFSRLKDIDVYSTGNNNFLVKTEINNHNNATVYNYKYKFGAGKITKFNKPNDYNFEIITNHNLKQRSEKPQDLNNYISAALLTEITINEMRGTYNYTTFVELVSDYDTYKFADVYTDNYQSLYFDLVIKQMLDFNTPNQDFVNLLTVLSVMKSIYWKKASFQKILNEGELIYKSMVNEYSNQLKKLNTISTKSVFGNILIIETNDNFKLNHISIELLKKKYEGLNNLYVIGFNANSNKLSIRLLDKSNNGNCSMLAKTLSNVGGGHANAAGVEITNNVIEGFENYNLPIQKRMELLNKYISKLEK